MRKMTTTPLTPEQATEVRHIVNKITQKLIAVELALTATNYGDAAVSVYDGKRLAQNYTAELTVIITPPVA